MIKYSDASHVKMAGSNKVSSEEKMRRCCLEKVAKADCGYLTCVCGNRIHKNEE